MQLYFGRNILKTEATHSHSAVAQMCIEADLYSFVGKAAQWHCMGSFLHLSAHTLRAHACGKETAARARSVRLLEGTGKADYQQRCSGGSVGEPGSRN